MPLWTHYYTPATVAEAVDLLQRHAGQARVVAGGTDLLVDMRANQDPPHEALVDITRIPDLMQIQDHGDTISIGAGVTHAQIVKSPLIIQYATALVEGCGVVGGPQVRNVATLGGNVAHALPAGDGTTSLVTLGAEVDVVHHGEEKRVPILEMYQGPGKSLLDSSRDLLVRFHFRKTGPREATAFKRIMRPQGVALPVLSCAVWIQLDETLQNYADARICIAPMGPRPLRVTFVEEAMIGLPANDETIAHLIEIAHENLNPRTSAYRATADYRRELIGVLLRRTLLLAANRVRTGQITPEIGS